jgi:PAS domain S-box-containing protein
MTVMAETLFESLLDVAPDAMIAVDEAGMIQWVNARTEEVFGYPRNELVGQPIELLVPDADKGAHVANRLRYVEAPTVRTMSDSLDIKGRRRDGSEFPADIVLSFLRTDSGLLVTAAVRDITLRRQAEADLRRMSDLIESTDNAVISKTIDGTVTSWNRGAERLYGYTADEMVGRTVAVLMPPGQPDEVPGLLRNIAAGQGAVYIETTRRRKDGQIIDVSMTISPITDARGEVVGASTIALDITDRKNMDRALVESERRIRELNADLESHVAELTNAMSELESFSYSVSHDLRAPLRAIDGFSRILVEDYADTLDAEGRRLLDIIRDGASSMAHLIDDLLAFSRLGRQTMQPVPVDMNDLVRAAVQEARAAASAADSSGREAEIVVHPLPEVAGDPRMLRQVFVNLLSNAIKFSAPSEHPRVEVEGHLDGDHAVYVVRDNGVGFDTRYKDKLFQVFHRLHTADFEGTGVGLAIVQRIVTRHGGQVSADSTVGEGATFSVTLPLTVGTDE